MRTPTALLRSLAAIATAIALSACTAAPTRVATYNLEDVRTNDVTRSSHPRLETVAGVIRTVRPDILLLQEIARDEAGTNAQRFADRYLPKLGMTAYMPETNTGIASGHDLDNNGVVVDFYPEPEDSDAHGRPPRQTPEERAYGNDCFGFGTFPGQYAMALLVRPGYTILTDRVRTYRLFRWTDLPGAESPRNTDGSPWYSPAAWVSLRLSSKTLADVPVRLPDSTVLHCVISHPTPPAFDGPEGRNKARNRDEIRLLRAFLDNEPWLIDDQGNPGGLPPGEHAVVMGDLNADPVDGSALDDPIALLMAASVLGPDPMPSSDVLIDGLDPTDTARFRLRVDYVLPTSNLEVLATGVHRPAEGADPEPSDHFMVWADIVPGDAPNRASDGGSR